MTYHAVTVTLENITGITPNKGRAGDTQSLNFNVTVQGVRQYAVLIRGAPRLENGTVVTAVLRDPNNWQTLVGWRNHLTGEICGVDSPTALFLRCLFALAVGIPAAVEVLDEKSGGYRVYVLVMIVLFNMFCFGAWLKSLRVHRLLRP
ncbi:hypothetical protein [Paraburkholderia phenoliruptrix]|uniref:Transmembrane protein n=1 Tax=Paraburkholderia phenoliruptrix TaxID=252970 RepID=A0A6J5JY45_9BURK|nr:hypothetical protein [Paraburkholderia phenoliruptrix]MDR6417949.1 hypothetical protein [Paraburkholderia phenoliruptrix]CAB4046620.1 hypothetical protein LMG9964_00251 [Paraburkholderia phenoliruptrix]